MSNVYDTLLERGLIAQTTHENEIKELLKNEKVTFYIGFDPTADSLHVGHFLQMVVMRHMQLAGHRPIAIIGGGTAMVGDPSGRTDMRSMMTPDTIQHNANCFKSQLSRLIEFGEDKALMINNADWLLNLNYIDFLRKIGVHFSVNRMLACECFKSRLEKGLSFIEFNYMLMQSYDFLVLNQKYGCYLELGGDDQWSNILGGIDLIRRIEGKEAYGMTFTLLTTSDGTKMGKTAKGAMWLDPNKVSPYDFYQYWRNISDEDVCRCLKLVTFVSMDTIREYEKLEGSQLNPAKELLAFEVTRMVHGENEAIKSQDAARAIFANGGVSDDMPTKQVSMDLVGEAISAIDLVVAAGFVASKSEARRLVQQGGLTINDKKIETFDSLITPKDFGENGLIARRGKKAYIKITLK